MHLLLAIVALIGLSYLAARRVAPERTQEVETIVTDTIFNFLARLEGFRHEPYQDQAGRWTIGYGHLIVPGDGFWHPDFNASGKKYISVADGKALYEHDSAAAREAVERNVKVPLSENQKHALISLVYNIGAGAFAGSALLGYLNQYQYEKAAAEFPKWNKVTKDGVKVVHPHLVSRRQTEMELFLS